MSPQKLLQQLEEAGLVLMRDGENLRLTGPEEVRKQWVPEVRRHKSDLMRILPEPWVVSEHNGQMVLVEPYRSGGVVVDEFEVALIEIPGQDRADTWERWLVVRRPGSVNLYYRGRCGREAEAGAA